MAVMIKYIIADKMIPENELVFLSGLNIMSGNLLMIS